jgi:thiol-disulfide isomerase/thioredoxin
MGVMDGLIALAATVAAATVLGVVLRRRSGRFRAWAAGPAPDAAGPTGAGSGALTEADLGHPLGRRATLVQFSTEWCATCRPTRQLLAQVAETAEGVTHVEIDAGSRLDLTRRMRVTSAPTVLVLGPDGAVVTRAVGLPRKADVVAALAALTEPAGAVIPETPAPAAEG